MRQPLQYVTLQVDGIFFILFVISTLKFIVVIAIKFNSFFPFNVFCFFVWAVKLSQKFVSRPFS